MEQYIIKGGNPLVGDVTISGAKNAALGILAASIMTDDDVLIDNLPDVRDINVMLEAIQEIGARVDRIDRHTVKINGSGIKEVSVDDEYIRRIRASYYFIGALLGKYKSAQVPLPGGCNIGSRPIDNRPLKFEEFTKKLNDVIYVSATPGDYEMERVNNKVVEQIIRPTGLLDPLIEVRPTKNQIDNLVEEINKQIEKNERTLITTLTIRMAEELTNYLKSLDIKVAYLHSEVKTLERLKIIRDLRLGKYDVVVGINLLREGIDIPEVSLIAILDAPENRASSFACRTFSSSSIGRTE